MTTEKILIIMLLYVLVCVVVYYVVAKYVIDRKRGVPKKRDNGKSIIHDLELDRNIFDAPRTADGLDRFEIDSPYGRKRIDDLMGGPEDKQGGSKIGKKIRRLLE